MLLSAFCWMLCEGILLYCITTVVAANHEDKMKYFYLLGWGEYLLFLFLIIFKSWMFFLQTVNPYWPLFGSNRFNWTHLTIEWFTSQFPWSPFQLCLHLKKHRKKKKNSNECDKSKETYGQTRGLIKSSQKQFTCFYKTFCCFQHFSWSCDTTFLIFN